MSMKGEKYASKSAMKRHEKMESAREMMMEYGKVKGAKKAVKKAAVKKVAMKKMGKKK